MENYSALYLRFFTSFLEEVVECSSVGPLEIFKRLNEKALKFWIWGSDDADQYRNIKSKKENFSSVSYIENILVFPKTFS